jgi:hypothetical protein
LFGSPCWAVILPLMGEAKAGLAVEGGGGGRHRGEFWSRAVSCARTAARGQGRLGSSAPVRLQQMKTWLSASIFKTAVRVVAGQAAGLLLDTFIRHWHPIMPTYPRLAGSEASSKSARRHPAGNCGWFCPGARR